MKLMISVHNIEGRISATVIDKKQAGKTLRDKKQKIDLKSKFYDWKEKDEEEIIRIVEDSKLTLFVGKEAIEFALEKDMIDKENIKKIQGAPFCHLLKV